MTRLLLAPSALALGFLAGLLLVPVKKRRATRPPIPILIVPSLAAIGLRPGRAS